MGRKYQQGLKKCPVCDSTFIVRIGAPKEKTTCSTGCANTYFRSGKNNPNYKTPKERARQAAYYRELCFEKYGHKCLLCPWHICIDVHHVDRNHNNNQIDNLVPLCPNHHKMIHIKKYREQLERRIQRECGRW